MKKNNLIAIFLLVIMLFSCNSNMLEKAKNSMEDPRIPEINVKQASEAIASGDTFPINFANGVRVKDESEPVVFTIENSGTSELEITSINTGGQNPDVFNVSDPAEFVIGAGSNTTFTVSFSPGDANQKSALVTIISNDFNEAEYSFTITAISRPVPMFSARLRRGMTPLTVDFEDKSIGDITSREWNFGDGSTSTLSNPTHVYSSSGTYTVTLNVAGSGGQNFLYKIDYMTVVGSIKHSLEKYTVPMDYISVYADDIDGDNDADIVSTRTWNGTNSEVALWTNIGNGVFLKTTIDADYKSTWAVTTGDVDGDSNKDILVITNSDAYWYKNNGNGTFNSTANIIDTAEDFSNNHSIKTVDIDKDGDLDIAGGVWNSASIMAWWENDGSGNFVWNTISPISDAYIYSFPVDIDGDTDMDIITAGQYNKIITLWLNDGAQNFTGHVVDNSFDNTYGITAGDVDGDGEIDLIASAEDDNEIAWWKNDGGLPDDGTPWVKHVITNTFRSVHEITAVDIDNDSDLDIIGAALGSERISWWENNSAEFTEHAIDTFLSNAVSVQAARFDGDEYIDAVAAGGNEIAWWNIKLDNWWYPVTLNNSFDTVRSVRSADIDGDGDMDLVTAAIFGNEVAWCENDGSDRFTKKHTITDSLPGAWYADAVDMDLDGDVDIISSGIGVLGDDGIASSVSWWENDGSAGFTEHVIDGAVGLGADFAADDIDNDGDIDVLYLDSGTDTADYTDGRIILQRNDGSMDFTQSVIVPVLEFSFSFSLSELNGDDYPDILYVRMGSNTILWRENNGDGTFGSEQVIDSTFHDPYKIIGADIDGDNDVDVISAGDQEVAWWENDGTGDFSASGRNVITTEVSGDNPSICPADLNGDGNMDILLRSGSLIAWWENDGQTTPSFLKNTVTTQFISSGFSLIYAPDFDNDGDADIINTQGNEIVAWENNLASWGQ